MLLLPLLIAGLFAFQGATAAPQAAPPTAKVDLGARQLGTSSQPGAGVDPALVARRLLSVKRIYLDSFGDDLISKQVQAMVMLHSPKANGSSSPKTRNGLMLCSKAPQSRRPPKNCTPTEKAQRSLELPAVTAGL